LGLWKNQIELILEKHGLWTFVVHPEYLVSEEAKAIGEGRKKLNSLLPSDPKAGLCMS